MSERREPDLTNVDEEPTLYPESKDKRIKRLDEVMKNAMEKEEIAVSTYTQETIESLGQTTARWHHGGVGGVGGGQNDNDDDDDEMEEDDYDPFNM